MDGSRVSPTTDVPPAPTRQWMSRSALHGSRSAMSSRRRPTASLKPDPVISSSAQRLRRTMRPSGSARTTPRSRASKVCRHSSAAWRRSASSRRCRSSASTRSDTSRIALTRTVRPSWGIERARISTGTREPSARRARCWYGSSESLLRCDSTSARSSSATNCSTRWPTRSETSQPRIFAIWSLASTNVPASVMATPSKAAAESRLNRSLLSCRAPSERSRSMAAPKTAAAALRDSTSEADQVRSRRVSPNPRNPQ